MTEIPTDKLRIRLIDRQTDKERQTDIQAER